MYDPEDLVMNWKPLSTFCSEIQKRECDRYATKRFFEDLEVLFYIAGHPAVSKAKVYLAIQNRVAK